MAQTSDENSDGKKSDDDESEDSDDVKKKKEPKEKVVKSPKDTSVDKEKPSYISSRI